MMRFPLGLSADLARALLHNKIRGTRSYPLVVRVFGGDDLRSGENSAALAKVRGTRAPVVWIERSPENSGSGALTREIIRLGRTVFLEVRGRAMRRGLHELPPVPRLYLTVQLDGLEDAQHARRERQGSFRNTLEGIHAAKLSGFHICVQTAVYADTELRELAKLSDFLESAGVDGWVQTCAMESRQMAGGASKMAEAAKLIHNSRWRAFSRALDLAGEPQENRAAAEIESFDEDPQASEVRLP